ncbi:hypothetical protein N9A76_02425 [Mariniblastus sp.]|nr:hypothetical protein [Mariniblastus sp.]
MSKKGITKTTPGLSVELLLLELRLIDSSQACMTGTNHVTVRATHFLATVSVNQQVSNIVDGACPC